MSQEQDQSAGPRKLVIYQPGTVVVRGGTNTIEVHIAQPRGDPLSRV